MATITGGSGTITAADVASSTSSGAAGQTLITGAPTAGSFVLANLGGGLSTFAVQITGNGGGSTFVFEQSVDGGVTWVAFPSAGVGILGTATSATTATTNGVWQGSCAVASQVRVRCTAYVSGTPAVAFSSSTAEFSGTGGGPTPAGTNTIGATQDAGPAWASSHGIVAGVPFTSADQHSAAASVTDAPTAGQKLVITDLFVSVDTAMSVTFKCETTAVVVAGPFYLSANSAQQFTPRSKAWKLATADKKLQVITSVAGNLMVDTHYYSEA